MPWLNSRDYLKKKRGKGKRIFCGPRVYKNSAKASGAWLHVLPSAPSQKLRIVSAPIGRVSRLAEACRSDSDQATSQSGIIDLKSRIARQQPGFGFALCRQPTR
jgi:hypothetical protein